MGFGDVKAKTLAVATASAYVLNSATGVIFPSTSIAPPITTTSFAFRNVSGSSAAARARFVKGPTDTIVIVSTGFSRSRRRISLCAGVTEAVNDDDGEASSRASAICSGVAFSGGGWNKVFHASDGE